MSLTWIAAGLLALAALVATLMEPVAPALTAMTPAIATTAAAEENAGGGLLYGRVVTEGAVFEGRLRWGGDEEALWSNYFNGAKSRNPWSVHAPFERRTFKVFGLDIGGWSSQIDVGRPFMARFGDIARLDRFSRREWRIALKSGDVAHIAWGGADDMNDGVRVWDSTRGVVNLAESPIRTIASCQNRSSGAAGVCGRGGRGDVRPVCARQERGRHHRGSSVRKIACKVAATQLRHLIQTDAGL